MRMGESMRAGHLRAATHLRCGGCWERSERKAPKKNCIPNAAVMISIMTHILTAKTWQPRGQDLQSLLT